jgi:hypothetical protein
MGKAHNVSVHMRARRTFSRISISVTALPFFLSGWPAGKTGLSRQGFWCPVEW